MAAARGAPPADSLPLLQFVPWQSAVDVGFWQKLAARKLAELRLSEAEQPLAGHFTASTHTQVSAAPPAPQLHRACCAPQLCCNCAARPECEQATHGCVCPSPASCPPLSMLAPTPGPGASVRAQCGRAAGWPLARVC